MKKFALMFLLSLHAISVYSAGQRDRESVQSRQDNMEKTIRAPLDLNPSQTGNIQTVDLENEILIINDSIRISCAIGEQRKPLFSQTGTFKYLFHQRPDGAVITLVLDNPGLSAWIGDGIRSGMGPEGLKIFPGDGIKSILLKSADDSWMIPAEEETVISWGEGSWIVYASKITLGLLQDQPAFKADVVILKQ